MHRNRHYTVGVDIGGTKIAIALVDYEGNVINEKRIPTQLEKGSEIILDEIGKQINLLVQEYRSRILGIGVAIPGYIDVLKGEVKNAVNLDWKNVKVINILNDAIHNSFPIYLQRDTVAETLGEYYFGVGKNCQNFVFLGIGTGFGAGALTSGHLLTGSNNLALEIGHLSLDQDGPICACGNFGCIETILSGKGLVDRATVLFTASNDPAYEKIKSSISTEQILAMAKAQDPIAESLINQMSQSLGFVCAMLKTIIDPERFIVGGGLGKALFNMLINTAENEMNARVLKLDNRRVRFFRSNLTTSAMGAAAMVWYFNDLFPKSEKGKNG